MSSHHHLAPAPSLDFRKLRRVPNTLLIGGGLLALIGAGINLRQFGFSWLTAFMVSLSVPLGALFLVMMHHLFDAGWSVPVRRVSEHLACLTFPAMAVLFVPIALLAFRIFAWLTPAMQSHPDHSLAAKYPLFTAPAFYVGSALCFLTWWLVSSRLRSWSLRQDESGAAECTFAMRRWSSVGIILFASTLTLGVILWMKSLQWEWFSTMYGVYYFAGSVWLALANVYVITLWLEQTGVLRGKLHHHQYYFLGSLFFAFTVFYAYIAFSQYFIIWNANVPEETFWYKLREQGSWYYVGIFLIFGHFFLPFLALLRIDAKHYFPLMLVLWAWAWIMHFVDMGFNILPVLHPEGVAWRWLWLDLGCLAFMMGLLIKLFIARLQRHPAYPIKDPRLPEALGLCWPKPRLMSGGELGETDEIEEEIDGSSSASGKAPGGAR
jgi:hypothetical protein